MVEPCTRTWRVRSVVRPKESLARAYSSLPTRMRVVSSRRTTVASTLSRGSPASARSWRDAAPDARQRPGEGEHAPVLGLVAHFAPARVIAVLLAPARVAAGGLQMAVVARADPDLVPGGRNRQRADACQRFRIAQRPAVGPQVPEPRAGTLARDPRRGIVHVAQAGGLGRALGLRVRVSVPGHGVEAARKVTCQRVTIPAR